ncbi:GGDEF domain-containing protein [Mangrovibacillus cuniculi]|uniref:GGDEF domain-containing protein n=1 Tax=Mangrovibacillus cuniculi TaxID=2593652 RepID=A0A7S8CDR3_9BACI|nr:GGDEF domain-containing protein [Mangrovibacillus cuniculi]QPC48115.1 GGDEF domain-containing protein [Mangrovibacillus cuniculi]
MGLEIFIAVLLFSSILFNILQMMNAKNKIDQLQQEKSQLEIDNATYQRTNEILEEQLEQFSVKIFRIPINERLPLSSLPFRLIAEDVQNYEAMWDNIALKSFDRFTFQTNEGRWIEFQTSLFKGDYIDVLVQDITEQKQKELHYRQLAYYDELTELPNRSMLYRHLTKVLSRAKRKNRTVAAMFLDLDGFKEVNDTLGHDGGDELLKEVARRLDATIREEDFVCRLAGDEFIIVIEETCPEEINQLAARIIEVLYSPYQILPSSLSLSTSIGIALFPNNATNMEEILVHADKAMYIAKNNGKNRFEFYQNSVLEDENDGGKSIMEKFFGIFSTK